MIKTHLDRSTEGHFRRLCKERHINIIERNRKIQRDRQTEKEKEKVVMKLKREREILRNMEVDK